MFGMRLKSWMEAHLGKSRQKSVSRDQNQKSNRVLKETSSLSPDCGVPGSSSKTTTTIATTTTVTSGGGGLSSSNGNPHPVELNNLREEQQASCCNLDSSPSFDLTSTTNKCNSPSSSSVQIQSGSLVVVNLAQSAQIQKQPANHPTKDYEEDEEKVDEQHHHQGPTCTRSSTTGSVSNSTSHNILFCNNLSSPDTGYSTDGYSPKSVCPALSFESSGKSTPKSSYTISSLVSSELHLSSKGNTASLSSASCSVNNGLESDHYGECLSPTPRVLLKTSTSLPPHSETDRSNLGLGNCSSINEKGSSQSSPGERYQNEIPHLVHSSHSINHASNKPLPSTTTTQDSFSFNDTVSDTQCNLTKSSVSRPAGEISPHQQHQKPPIGESGGSMVAAKQTLSNFTSHCIRQDKNNEPCNNPNSSNGFSKISTNPFCSNQNQIQSSPSSSTAAPTDNNLHNHRRPESLDERKSTVLTSLTLPDSEGNSSSLLTASGNRNIRTSFVLVTTATSQIPECNSFNLKNAFSICSPRKERTRIKMGISGITFANDGNSNANKTESNSNSPVPEMIRVNKVPGAGHRHSSVSESAAVEKVAMHNGNLVRNRKSTCLSPNSDGGGNGNECDNQQNDGVKTAGEINNRSNEGERGKDHQNGDSSSLVYRISTSTSASDSGKGSLDLESGTNRNSTESSCLSDSASTRNSIISHEAELRCSRSSSSTSSASFLTYNNDHKAGEQQQSTTHGVGVVSSAPVKVGGSVNLNKDGSRGGGSTKSTPVSVKKFTASKGHNINNPYINANDSSQFEDQDVTSTSITLPPELISSHRSANVSAQTNVIMVDKETDILSDWANTDDDGEDEIETDRNDDDDQDSDKVTPTPSSPDTDTGGRVRFHNSQSTSSVTDIDFGDSSAATAASSTGIAPSSSIFRSHYTQNGSKSFSTNKGSRMPEVVDPYHNHHNIMNPQPICYSSNANQQQGHEHGGQWYESEVLGSSITRMPAESDILVLTRSGVMCPTGQPLGISNALYSDATEFADYNANKPQNSYFARGALGFLRKIFKKGSCSSHRTSPGSDKVKIPRSAKSKDSHLDNIASITGLRSTSLVTTTADALVSPHPLVTRKQSINGYFLTPTPNAFRRRSGGTGTDSSDSNKGGSKHFKSVKTDIIRLPPGALSPTQTQNANSSSSTSSSKNTSIGAFCISSLQNNSYATGNGNNIHGYSNTNTNSTASSIHSMSTSTSVSNNGICSTGGENHANGHTPSSGRQNQSRLNDNFYSNSNSNASRQSPFLSSSETGGRHPIPVGTHSNKPPPPLPALPPVPQSPMSPYLQHNHPNITTTGQISHQQERDFGGHAYRPPSRTGPYESPRLQNPSHKINSPSFNNYSPIHRLVVTSGAAQLLNRGGPFSNPSNCVSPIPPCHHPDSIIHPSSRNGNGVGGGLNHHHNNNTPSTIISNINRSSSFHPNPTSSPSPLINRPQHQHQHQSSVSSPRPHLPSSNTFTSPSPILRNPRYQYITSSNQNSPVLNVPKRMNGPIPTPPPPNQHYYYHNHNNEGHGVGSIPNAQIPYGPPPPPPPPSFSTFSPTPPPRQNTQPNNNPFPAASPNLNHHQLYSQQSPLNPCITTSRQHRGVSSGVESEVTNSPNPNLLHRGGGPVENNPCSSSNNRNKLLSRSQSYQTHGQQQQPSHPVHYYASPVASQPIPPSPQSHGQQRVLPHHGPIHPTSLSFNEPPLLMRAHLHNQNVRLNNFLMNKQRHQQSLPGHDVAVGGFPHSESFQERIYETVDSEDDDEENSNLDDQDINSMHQNNIRDQHFFHPNMNGVLEQWRKNRLPTTISNQETGFPFSNKSNEAGVASKSRTQQSSKSKRSKTKPPAYGSQYEYDGESGGDMCQPRPRPPVPMALFGPNTFLSETETRLLETDDRDADRKYMRLINEAEALLREISVVKSQQQPWAQRMQDRQRVEDCPQSDPLRRKAYDCWALRRLQQELAATAGCASPPVLHRSRMNLQSPSTPTGTAASMLNPYFSLVPNQQMANANFTDSHNQNNAHF